jgi:para-aminobenzoate synthetase component 1
MYYNLAKSWAEKRGADEALILNPDQTISETNTANILLVKDSMAIRPKSKHVLPGIMESAVCKALARFGYEVWQREMFTHDLPNADALILTNSLMGAVSAKSLDGIPLEQDNDLV